MNGKDLGTVDIIIRVGDEEVMHLGTFPLDMVTDWRAETLITFDPTHLSTINEGEPMMLRGFQFIPHVERAPQGSVADLLKGSR